MTEWNEDDYFFMRRAIELARLSLGHTRPNPAVGAVIVKGGRIIGEGRHVKCGEAHAEAAALAACSESAAGATAYVTLEPCSKVGRVGACTEALIAAGVKRVVWACEDPNPTNKGGAKAVLEGAGIETASGLCKDEAYELIKAFAKHVTTGLPYVTVKLAMSLDGKICDNYGDAKWISSEEARAHTGAIRERVDCVMVGAHTVRCDNPSLLCRTKRNDDLYRAVISRSGDLPPQSQIFTDEAKERTLVYSDARSALEDLGRRGFIHILCEGGLELARSLARDGYVDEWITVLSPIVIGDKPIGEAVRFGKAEEMLAVGEDTITRSLFNGEA